MNLNTGPFPAYNHRRTDGYRSIALNNQQHHHASFIPSARSSTESTNAGESFLPSLATINSSNDGHRPHRRNDFANNHLFIAKRKLARIFLDQPPMKIQSTSDLVHLFDQHEPKQRNRSINKNKRQENNSDIKTTDQNVHLSVVNLVMKPVLPSLQPRDPLAAISYRRGHASNLQTRAPRSSIEWINPALKQYSQLTSNHTNEDDIEPNTISDELIDNNIDALDKTIDPIGSSLLYVKSIILSTGPPHSNHH